MVKLYYAPGACSQADHIALRWAGVNFDLARVQFPSHTLEDGSDYYAVNPSGAVPALRLDDGSVLTENAAILLYIASLAPSKGLTPAYGSAEYFRVVSDLSFLSSELHKGFSPLFNPALTPEAREAAVAVLNKKFAVLESKLAGKKFLQGDVPSVADVYAYVLLSWRGRLNVDVGTKFPSLIQFSERVEATLPQVKEAQIAEGIRKAE